MGVFGRELSNPGDHVVVTRGQVFAIETKSRLKPDRGGGADEAKVVFDGQALLFPGWIDTATLEQARRQATWLGRWLSKAVGTAVEVKPVVALPGWYVERKAKSDVRVISGRESKSLMSGWRGEPLSDEMMNRIAHQLEERCRDVEPTQYGRAKLHREGHPGLVSKSARCEGDVYSILNASVLSNPRQAMFLTYTTTMTGIAVEREPGVVWLEV